MNIQSFPSFVLQPRGPLGKASGHLTYLCMCPCGNEIKCSDIIVTCNGLQADPPPLPVEVVCYECKTVWQRTLKGGGR